MEERVTIEVAHGIADVRLNRPEKLNALDPAMFAGIADTLDRLAALPGLRVVVLSGNGDGFCAGLDMASMGAAGPAGDLATRTHGDANLFQHVAWGWRTLPVPVIAAAHGVALGGGFQILSGADIRIAAPGTRCAIMEAKWGLVPDMAGIALWRGTARDDVLRELTYTARIFSAEEGVTLGLLTRIADDPHAAAMELAREITARSPDAVRAAKRLFAMMPDQSGSALLEAESAEQAALIRSPNQVEAVRANIEKRAPRFA